MKQPKSIENQVGRLLAEASRCLRQAGVESPERDSQELLARVTGCSRALLLADPQREISAQHVRRFQQFVRERCRRVPLQYLLGSEYFMADEFLVGKGVLIPRPETELLVEECFRRLQGRRPELLADLGTGSGIIALTLAKHFPKALVYGVDLSPVALRWARVNRRRLQLARVRLVQGDADRAIPSKYSGKFDLVASNPPYIPEADLTDLQPEVRQEPRLALAGGQDGLDGLRHMIAAANRLLTPGGFFVCELGIGQERQAREIFQQHEYSSIRVLPDWQNIARVISGQKS